MRVQFNATEVDAQALEDALKSMDERLDAAGLRHPFVCVGCGRGNADAVCRSCPNRRRRQKHDARMAAWRER